MADFINHMFFTFAMKFRQSIWNRKIRVPTVYVLFFSFLCLILLNRLTRGTKLLPGSNELCEYSLFGIWADEIEYLRHSQNLLNDIAYLAFGPWGRILWLYTIMHFIVAGLLGWAATAVLTVIRFLAIDKGMKDERMTS